MPQIINDGPGIGALLGTGLGQGISSGLQQIAQMKTNQLLGKHQQNQAIKGYVAIGIPLEQAQALVGFSPGIQELIVKNYLAAAQNSGLDQALQGTQVNPESQSEIPGLAEMGVPIQQQQQSPLQKLLGVQQPNILDKQLPSEKVFADLMGKRQAQSPVADKVSTPEKQLQKPTETKRNSLADVLLRPRLTPEHRLKVEALKQAKDLVEKKESLKDLRLIDKETKPFYDRVQRGARAAKDANIRLDKFEELIKKENLASPLFASFLKTLSNGIFGFGINLSALMNADSQEFEKLSNDFIKDAKEFFPGRVTDTDLKLFLQTIPTLSQTRAGKLRVIKNMREFNAIKLAQKEASDKILKQTGGRRPRNFEQIVEEAAAPHIDKIKKDFSNMAVPVDERWFKEFITG